MTIIPEDLMIKKPNRILFDKMNSVSINEKVLFEKKTEFHDITVVQNKIGRFLKYKDTYQAGFIKTKEYEGNIPYVNYFLIPYLMNKNIKTILFIGFGSGIVINQYEKLFEKLKNIDIVDIEEYIFPIAQQYFNFKKNDKMNFHLQDAIVFLKSTKKKYDLIVVDVAGNEGIDERFCEIEYLNLIQNKLKSDGIFVSNMPSSRDIFNKKNKFILNLIKKYKKVFKNINLYSGSYSNKIYYKAFFNIEDEVLDITNLIFISSNKNFNLTSNNTLFQKTGVDILPFLNDTVSF